MYKELIITVIIIGSVIGLDFFTQRYTEDSVEKMNMELNNLKNIVINDESYEVIMKSISRIEKLWNDKQNKLVYYIEHDEIEKVTERIKEIKGYSETKEAKESVHQIQSCMFLLNHIKDKEKFNFKNLF